jgi:branched-chain amino acid transport system permease protein
MKGFLQNCPTYLANGMLVGCLYALIAMGFNIIYSSTGVINFAQGEFAMLGALLAYQLAARAGLPVLLAASLSVTITAVIGIMVERAVIFPLRRTPVINMIIGTIGVSILLKSLARVIWPEEAYNVPPFTQGTFDFLGVTQRYQGLWVISLTAAAVVLTYLFFQRTMTGKAMKACSINRQAASLVGINVSRMSMYAFALSAALAAAGGLINAPAASYGMGLGLGISGFTAAVVGGLGSPFGAVVGGLTIGLLESVITGFLQVVLGVSSGYGEAVIPFVLVLMLLLRPQGLLGRGEKVRV